MEKKLRNILKFCSKGKDMRIHILVENNSILKVRTIQLGYQFKIVQNTRKEKGVIRNDR